MISELVTFVCCLAWIFAQAIPCNPQIEQGCVAKNPALQQTVSDPLRSFSKYFDYLNQPARIVYTNDSTRLGILQQGDNPRMDSLLYILYGKVEADILAASGQGIISSFYLQSDDLDEIDIAEIFGSNQAVYETNFFLKGNISTYGASEYHRVNVSTAQQFHRFGVTWTQNELVWLFDGKELRRVNLAQLPSSPMRVMFSLWAGGDKENNQGTVDWSGGSTDYTKLPFFMHVKNVYIENFSTGARYVYGRNGTVTFEKEPIPSHEPLDRSSQKDGSDYESDSETGLVDEDDEVNLWRMIKGSARKRLGAMRPA